VGEIAIAGSMKTALIAGATGLVGKQLLALLLQNDSYSSVKALTRKPLLIQHPKLQNTIVYFDALPSGESMKADDVYCCLGTTMKQARSKEAFKKVDFHYPQDIGIQARATGARQYILVSALGADKNSSLFYNKIKGETEEAIKNIGFPTLHIVRPSLLLGNRTEERTGEDAAKLFFKIFGFLVPEKYKAIDSLKVAKAMLFYAMQNKPGIFIHEAAELQRF
jgi:uncharacterized protein YbjT (DUF2867 family)